ERKFVARWGLRLTGPTTGQNVGRVSAPPPGFFIDKITTKTAGKNQKIPINAVTYRLGMQRIKYPVTNN
ncbi:hypothetical protein ACVGWI_18465, partial [Enterobacter hormaechei]